MGKNSKRPKSYYINNSKRRKPNNELGIGLTGFLCTCNAKEKECVREAYNILNEYADILYGKFSDEKEEKVNEGNSQDAVNQGSDSDSEDIEAELKTEVATIRENVKNKGKDSKYRFKQVYVDVNNCIFISTTLANPLELSLKIMDSIIETKKAKTQHLVRMTPVQSTCKAYQADMEKACTSLINEHFPKNKITFYVSMKIRNNSSIAKETVCKSLSKIICDFNVDALPDYLCPDIVLNIDVLKNWCCMALLPEYLSKYSRFNLFQLSQSKTKTDVGKSEVVQSDGQCDINKSQNQETSNEVKGSEDHKITPSNLVDECEILGNVEISNETNNSEGISKSNEENLSNIEQLQNVEELSNVMK